MAATETIRVRVAPEVKARLSEIYERKGTTISHEIRSFLYSELESNASAADRFDAIMSSADTKRKSAVAVDNKISVDSLVEYVRSVRRERAVEASVDSST